VTASMFLPEVLERPDVQALIQRTNPFIDDECDRLYPQKRSAFVRVALQGGRKLEIRLQDPKGEPANPMTNADLEHKLVANCEAIIGGERCSKLIEQVWQFETLTGAKDIVTN